MPKNNRNGKAAILTERDYAKIRKHLTNKQHRLIFDIARYTGERWGAIVQLGVYDVYAQPALSTPRSHITFRARTRKASPDGKRRTRQLYIHAALQEILLAYDPPLSGPLFQGVADEVHLSFSAAEKAFRVAVEKAGLGDRGISTHSTRRTFITNLSTKTDVRTLQAITGHADTKVLMGYIEVDEDRVKQAIALL